MTEANEVWRVTRQHVRRYGRFKRIESRTEGGIPDLNYTLLAPRGYQGWMELKLFSPIGVAPKHLTLDQIVWGEEEVKAGGNWHLFGRGALPNENRHVRFWVLYTIAEARKLYDGVPSSPVFQISGRFPLRELLLSLTTTQ